MYRVNYDSVNLEYFERDYCWPVEILETVLHLNTGARTASVQQFHPLHAAPHAVPAITLKCCAFTEPFEKI